MNAQHGLPRLLFTHEAFTVFLLVLAIFVGASLSPYFLSWQTVSDGLTENLEVGVMALAMTPLIVLGEIDLSVASILGLVAVVFGQLEAHEAPLILAIGAAVALGTLAGAANGFMVTRFGLSSIVVTLGTLALYRGIAQAIVGDETLLAFPDVFTGSDTRYVIAETVTVPHLMFAAAAIAAALVLHRMTLGRRIFFAGSSAEVARMSGVRADRIRVAAFAASGAAAAFAALLLVSRLQSVRNDTGQGLELLVITVVLLGGAAIQGGRGTIFGTVIALALVAAVRNAMGLSDVPDQAQVAVLGGLLLLAIAAGSALTRLQSNLDSRRALRQVRYRPPSAPVVAGGRDAVNS